jgi:hypothetical protein
MEQTGLPPQVTPTRMRQEVFVKKWPGTANTGLPQERAWTQLLRAQMELIGRIVVTTPLELELDQELPGTDPFGLLLAMMPARQRLSIV